MTLSGVSRAPVVDVVPLAVLRFLCDPFPCHCASAVGANDQPARVRQFVGLVKPPPEQSLHAVEQRRIDDWLVPTGIPLTLVRDFAQVRAIPEDQMNLAARELLL